MKIEEGFALLKEMGAAVYRIQMGDDKLVVFVDGAEEVNEISKALDGLDAKWNEELNRS